MFFAQKRGKLFGAPAGAYPLPWMGHDAPTTARIGTCRPMGFSPTSVPEGFQRTSGKPFGAPVGAYPLPRRGMTRRLRRERWGCCPEGAVLSFEAKESTKESQRHGDYEDGPRRCAPWASACGSRTVGRPEFIRGVQFRPLGRNSLTTFRGQTALRGCPRPRLAALTRRKKAFIAHFVGGARNVARNGVG